MSHTTFKVEKGIPAPEKSVRESKYPFELMEVGDSFVINACIETVRRRATKYRWSNAPWHFRIAKDADGNARLWRIEDTPKRVKGRK